MLYHMSRRFASKERTLILPMMWGNVSDSFYVITMSPYGSSGAIYSFCDRIGGYETNEDRHFE